MAGHSNRSCRVPGGYLKPRTADQLQLALDAPRPSPADCDVCARCQGGDCKRWRELQRQWIEQWQGSAPPESGAWGEWWKQVKTHQATINS